MRKEQFKHLARLKSNIKQSTSVVITLIKKVCRQATAKAIHHDNIYNISKNQGSKTSINSIYVSQTGA